ncbi:Rab escort protein 1 [Tanacetum coccineum]|uniref:Rab escort protein 1 n=1 Tax=Tanacetum coccineum TaxID=301880 RepID=A0ABQ5AKC0_9ASTR
MTESIPPYPPIEPSHFDLIVIGTGLPSSIIAAAASTAGKSVLHLDSNSFYGSHFSSLSLHDVTSFLTTSSPDHADVTIRQIYSDVEINCHDESVLESSRKYNLDLSGPRVLFCADECVNLLLRSGGNQYVEFKNIEASFVGSGGERGELVSVPDSKSAVFKDRTLKFSEKNQLNSFFKMVQGHFGNEEGGRIQDEDLESSFVEFLDKIKLPPKIKSIILYAIAMVDYDQDAGESCKDILKTRDGIDRLALYHSSVGRFPTATWCISLPLLLGILEKLNKAFCRRACCQKAVFMVPYWSLSTVYTGIRRMLAVSCSRYYLDRARWGIRGSGVKLSYFRACLQFVCTDGEGGCATIEWVGIVRFTSVQVDVVLGVWVGRSGDTRRVFVNGVGGWVWRKRGEELWVSVSRVWEGRGVREGGAMKCERLVMRAWVGGEQWWGSVNSGRGVWGSTGVGGGQGRGCSSGESREEGGGGERVGGSCVTAEPGCGGGVKEVKEWSGTLYARGEGERGRGVGGGVQLFVDGESSSVGVVRRASGGGGGVVGGWAGVRCGCEWGEAVEDWGVGWEAAVRESWVEVCLGDGDCFSAAMSSSGMARAVWGENAWRGVRKVRGDVGGGSKWDKKEVGGNGKGRVGKSRGGFAGGGRGEGVVGIGMQGGGRGVDWWGVGQDLRGVEGGGKEGGKGGVGKGSGERAGRGEGGGGVGGGSEGRWWVIGGCGGAGGRGGGEEPGGGGVLVGEARWRGRKGCGWGGRKVRCRGKGRIGAIGEEVGGVEGGVGVGRGEWQSGEAEWGGDGEVGGGGGWWGSGVGEGGGGVGAMGAGRRGPRARVEGVWGERGRWVGDVGGVCVVGGVVEHGGAEGGGGLARCGHGRGGGGDRNGKGGAGRGWGVVRELGGLGGGGTRQGTEGRPWGRRGGRVERSNVMGSSQEGRGEDSALRGGLGCERGGMEGEVGWVGWGAEVGRIVRVVARGARRWAGGYASGRGAGAGGAVSFEKGELEVVRVVRGEGGVRAGGWQGEGRARRGDEESGGGGVVGRRKQFVRVKGRGGRAGGWVGRWGQGGGGGTERGVVRRGARAGLVMFGGGLRNEGGGEAVGGVGAGEGWRIAATAPSGCGSEWGGWGGGLRPRARGACGMKVGVRSGGLRGEGVGQGGGGGKVKAGGGWVGGVGVVGRGGSRREGRGGGGLGAAVLGGGQVGKGLGWGRGSGVAKGEGREDRHRLRRVRRQR